MALIWSKKSTGVPIRVKTSHVTGGVLNEDGERKIGDKISECVLDIGALVLLLLLQLFVNERLQLTYCLYSMLHNNHKTFTKTAPESYHIHNPPTTHLSLVPRSKSSSVAIGPPTNHAWFNTYSN